MSTVPVIDVPIVYSELPPAAIEAGVADLTIVSTGGETDGDEGLGSTGGLGITGGPG